jgi:hypothetical protein
MSILIDNFKFELQWDLLPFQNHNPLNIITIVYKGSSKLNKFKITLSTCFIKIGKKKKKPEIASSFQIDICSTLVQTFKYMLVLLDLKLLI